MSLKTDLELLVRKYASHHGSAFRQAVVEAMHEAFLRVEAATIARRLEEPPARNRKPQRSKP